MTPAEKLAEEKKSKGSVPEVKKPSVLICSLKKIREDLGLTLRDVAPRIGMSHSNLANLEDGDKTSLVTALVLARFYGKTVEEIWQLKVGAEKEMTDGS